MTNEKQQPIEAEIKNRFDSILNTVLKVIGSCRTQEQLSNAFNWGFDVIYTLAEMFERTKNPAVAKFAHSYKTYVALKARELYREKQGDMNAIPDVPDAKITIREVEPHIGICRNCSGKGTTAHISGRTCPSCNGSGRVRVSSLVRTMVKPYDPEREDPRFPVKMD